MARVGGPSTSLSRTMDGFASLQAAIGNRIGSQPSRPYAVLDFDNTCIVNDVAEATLAYICRNQLLRRADLLPGPAAHCDRIYHRDVFRRYYALLCRDDLQSASLLCARVLAGFTGKEAETIVAAAIDAEGSIAGVGELYGISIARGLAVRPVLRKLIDFLRANEVQVWIVSASPDVAVRTAMKHFGLPGEVIALRSKLDDGVISTDVEAPYSVGEGKVDCIKMFIHAGHRPLVAVGDSMHDVPMLEYAHIRAVVDCNEKLANEARRRHWFVLRCHPRRARSISSAL
jgi:phosphoserine phosphatase